VIDSGLTVVPSGFQTIKSVLLARPEDGEQTNVMLSSSIRFLVIDLMESGGSCATLA
jgi:hypothetical protein